jgi:hypothetical protein
MADIMDKLLTPEDGGNTEGGKALIRQLFAAFGAQFKPPGHNSQVDLKKEDQNDRTGNRNPRSDNVLRSSSRH